MRRERGTEILHAAALSTDPREQEDGMRHQLAQAAEVLGARGAGDRANGGQPAVSEPLAAQLVHKPRQALEQRWIALVLDLGGAGVRGANEHEAAGPGTRGRLDQRLQGVAAEQRIGCEGVGSQAGDGAERAGRLSHQGLRVRPRGHRDVAALSVGQHKQAVVVRDRHHLLQRLPAGSAEPLEAGQLRLHRHAGRARRDDRRAAVLRDGLCRAHPREVRSTRVAPDPLHGLRPQS